MEKRERGKERESEAMGGGKISREREKRREAQSWHWDIL